MLSSADHYFERLWAMAKKVTVKNGDTIVFIGDSITDVDRRKAEYAPLGKGYVNFAANLVLARHASIDLKVVNTGISGDTVRSLVKRWQVDCLDHKPAVLSILIGINDLWRRFDKRPEQVTNAVYPEEYEAKYRQLLTDAKAACDPQLVLMEPFMFCNDKADPMFQGLPPYIEIVRRLAKEFDATLVPLQTHIDKEITSVPPKKWSGDMVHPSIWAHAWIAERWLEATGL
jgi:acyl-CoA thioesterase I